MSLVESQHLKRKTGRPRGRPVGSANPGLADRLTRFRMQERYAKIIDECQEKFCREVMFSKAENGKGPDGRGWAYTFDERMRLYTEMHNRAYGRAPVQVAMDETSDELRRVIHEVRWLPPDPNDRSNRIEPEPD
jgi:hypothetical protein